MSTDYDKTLLDAVELVYVGGAFEGLMNIIRKINPEVSRILIKKGPEEALRKAWKKVHDEKEFDDEVLQRYKDLRK